MHSKNVKIVAMTKDLLLKSELEKLQEEYKVEIAISPEIGELLKELQQDKDSGHLDLNDTYVMIEISGYGREGIQIAETLKSHFPEVKLFGFSKLVAPDTVRRAKLAKIDHVISQDLVLKMLPEMLQFIARNNNQNEQ
ncbi:MAG TPA: hypothetical protein VEC36_09220 [Patescibacteria group bacterium]|nr:hypothetical protein [Patescibacteria group bacterium]